MSGKQGSHEFWRPYFSESWTTELPGIWDRGVQESGCLDNRSFGDSDNQICQHDGILDTWPFGFSGKTNVHKKRFPHTNDFQISGELDFRISGEPKFPTWHVWRAGLCDRLDFSKLSSSLCCQTGDHGASEFWKFQIFRIACSNFACKFRVRDLPLPRKTNFQVLRNPSPSPFQ